eukprot:gene14005-16509_t
MENNEEPQPEFTPQQPVQPVEVHAGTAAHPEIQLIVTEDIRSYLYDMAKWTKFLAIVGFIITGLTAMAAFGMGALMSALAKINPMMPALGSGVLTVYFLLIALLYFYPSLLMYKHSTAAYKAVLYGDQLSLSVAIKNLKSFFKFWGILMIVVIALYVLIFLLAIVGGITAASMGH